MNNYTTKDERSPAKEYQISGIEALRLGSIPAELKARPHWVAWNAVDRADGRKPDKVPINPRTGGKAMSNLSSTWGSFDEAVQRANRDKLAGIGLMFTGDDLIGIDLDNVIADGKFCDPLAEAVVRSMDTYTEISPSGKGVKMWIKSAVHPSRCNLIISHGEDSLDVETYNKGRWFAVTGYAMPQFGQGTVQERSERYSKMLAMGDKPKAKDKAVPLNAVPAEGDIQDEEDMLRAALRHIDPDHEGTWFRIGCCLKSWGMSAGDDLAKALWIQWSKGSDKFDQADQDGRWERMVPDGGLTIGSIFSDAQDEGYAYGDAIGLDDKQYHIDGQEPWSEDMDWWIAGVHGDPDFKPAIKPDPPKNAMPSDRLCHILMEEPETPPAILEDTFGSGDIFQIVGPSKSRKSFLLIQLGLCVASGIPFLGLSVKRHPVVLVNLEIRPAFFRKRLWHMARAVGVDQSTCKEVVIIHGRGRTPCDILKEAKAAAKRIGAGLIAIDPLYKLASGGDENSSADAKSVVAILDGLAEATGASIAYVHHAAKGASGDRAAIDRGSGSGVLARAYDAGLTMVPHRDAPNAMVCDWILRNYAPRDAFAIRWADNHYELANDLTALGETSRSRAAASLRGAPTESLEGKAMALLDGKVWPLARFKAEISAKLGIGDKKTRELLDLIKTNGIVSAKSRTYRGGWYIGPTTLVEEHIKRGQGT